MAKEKKILKEIEKVLKRHDCDKKLNLFVCAAGFELLMTMPQPMISYFDLKENCGERILKMIPKYLDEATWIEVNALLENYMGKGDFLSFVKASRLAADKLPKKHEELKNSVLVDLKSVEKLNKVDE